MIESYRLLADAIILMAVKDYRSALKKLMKRPNYEPAKQMKTEVERFFRSEWYRELTSVDGDILIRKLQAEVEH
jgi:hypothetical protein